MLAFYKVLIISIIFLFNIFDLRKSWGDKTHTHFFLGLEMLPADY